MKIEYVGCEQGITSDSVKCLKHHKMNASNYDMEFKLFTITVEKF